MSMRTLLLTIVVVANVAMAGRPNAQPVAPEDRAARSGQLSVMVEASRRSETMDVYAENGFPFDVRITTITTENCVGIVQRDCGVIDVDTVVPAGDRAFLYAVGRSSFQVASRFDIRFGWQPASRAKILDNTPR